MERPGRGASPARAAIRQPIGALLALSVIGVGAAGCAGPSAQHAPRARVPATACTRRASTATVVLAGPPDIVAAAAAQAFFSCAPVAVIASANLPHAVRLAYAEAARAHVPLLLTGPGTRRAASLVSPALRTAIAALHTHTVLTVGVPEPALARQLRGVQVVTQPPSLPPTVAPAPLGHAVLLVHQGDRTAAAAAAASDAQAAGARVIAVRGYDPRSDDRAIAALSAIKPRHILAVGTGFGAAGRVARRVAVASTGVQLPGGGQVLFPARRLVALYGHPGTAGLGALGEQSLGASIARVRRLAARYRPLSKVPVIPTFEIIASVAQGPHAPGPDGTYSYLTPVAALRPWVRGAARAGMYVVLDLQPGRASFLAQAKWYQRLLELPNVGLALDPEWKLQPGQLPLKQIGSVRISEVNSVITWLAGLTARRHLPQKLLVLHQFRLSMIQDERALDTRHDDLAIVIHMDGQGTPREKQQTWISVTGAAPARVFFGWKNFFVKDHPMLTPRQTMAHSPRPVMISYQ